MGVVNSFKYIVPFLYYFEENKYYNEILFPLLSCFAVCTFPFML